MAVSLTSGTHTGANDEQLQPVTFPAPESPSNATPTRDVLLAISAINDLLLAPGVADDLFMAVARAEADAFSYPLAAIGLFDSAMRSVEIAGISDPGINRIVNRYSPGALYRRALPLAHLAGFPWLDSVKSGEVYVTSRPVELLAPWAPHRRSQAILDSLGIRLGIVVPLAARGKLLGALMAGSTRTVFDEGEQGDLLVLAHHTAVAIEMWRLYTSAEGRAAEQAALARSARMIARAEHSGVLRTIAREGSHLMMGSQFEILLPDANGDLVCVNAHGPKTGVVLGFKARKGEGLIGRVFDTRQPVLVDDVQTAEGSANIEVDRAADFHAWMAVPMLTEDDCIGVLLAAHPEPALYTQSHLELLSTLADHATIALENGRLLSEARSTAAEQAALAEAAHAIARLDLDAVLKTIVQRASEIVKSSRCSLHLYDEKTHELYFAAGHNNSPALQTHRLPADAGIIGQVYNSGEPALIEDMQADPRSAYTHIDQAEQSHAFIAVPLKGHSGPIGVLVNSHHDKGVFTRRDVDLLTTFADYATIALSNAHLYRSLEQREQERTQLVQQLLTGQEAERRRVAVDIHDGPLQSIGVNILSLDRVRKLLTAGRAEQAAEELVEAREAMSAVVQELRNVINDLRPALLETFGLAVATEAHIKTFSQANGIAVTLEDDLDGERMPAPVEAVFYRLMQEALSNVRKHSGATVAWVKLSFYDGMLRMSITDNGRGFDPATAASSALASGHIGLHSMHERVSAIGGSLAIDAAPDRGTCLTFSAPIPS
jgi:signal transduction histidine kinase